jgi:hypothetical protein
MNISKILEGKKTYIGLIVTALGIFMPETRVEAIEATLNDVFTILGLAFAAFGRHKVKPKVVEVPVPTANVSPGPPPPPPE